jgi:hypothetical protein
VWYTEVVNRYRMFLEMNKERQPIPRITAAIEKRLGEVATYLFHSLDTPAQKLSVADAFIEEMREEPELVRHAVRAQYNALLMAIDGLRDLQHNLREFAKLPPFPQRPLPDPEELAEDDMREVSGFAALGRRHQRLMARILRRNERIEKAQRALRKS